MDGEEESLAERRARPARGRPQRPARTSGDPRAGLISCEAQAAALPERCTALPDHDDFGECPVFAGCGPAVLSIARSPGRRIGDEAQPLVDASRGLRPAEAVG